MTESNLESLKASRIENFESKPVMVSSSSPISEVLGVLKNTEVYEVFIQDERKVSTITVREILKASDISTMRASSLMFYVSKLSPDNTVGKAARLMTDYRLRALPIVREGTVEGVVTAQSLCRALLSVSELGDVRISKMMTRNLITIDKDETVSKARSLMLKNGVDHLPVLDLSELCGILLSNHIVLSMFPKEGLEKGAVVSKPSSYMDIKVSGLMDSDVFVCDSLEKSSVALKKMIEQGKTYSIVKLGPELQGIVTYRNFIVFLAEREEPDIPVYIMGLPEDPFEAELAKMKFIRAARALHKSYPKIEEIRAAIKTKDLSGERQRYEVDVSIKSPRKVYIYSEDGWDLPSIFDSISGKVKRLLTDKPVKKRRLRRRQ